MTNWGCLNLIWYNTWETNLFTAESPKVGDRTWAADSYLAIIADCVQSLKRGKGYNGCLPVADLLSLSPKFNFYCLLCKSVDGPLSIFFFTTCHNVILCQHLHFPQHPKKMTFQQIPGSAFPESSPGTAGQLLVCQSVKYSCDLSNKVWISV